MEMIARVSELMPAGKPDFISIPKYPAISKLVETVGKKKMLAVLVLLVKDFCSSFNVVRNMNEDQMIEAGSMLLEECGNFRLEDYVMMFTLAKKGKLVDIRDRIDLQIITDVLDVYWSQRNRAGNEAQEEDFKNIEAAIGSHVMGEWVDPTVRNVPKEESMAQLLARVEIEKQKANK